MLGGSIITWNVRPDRIDEFIGTVRDHAEPVVGAQPGIKQVIVMVDRQAGKVVAIGVWATEAEARAAGDNSRIREEIARLVALAEGPPLREVFEASIEM